MRRCTGANGATGVGALVVLPMTDSAAVVTRMGANDGAAAVGADAEPTTSSAAVRVRKGIFSPEDPDGFAPGWGLAGGCCEGIGNLAIGGFGIFGGSGFTSSGLIAGAGADCAAAVPASIIELAATNADRQIREAELHRCRGERTILTKSLCSLRPRHKQHHNRN